MELKALDSGLRRNDDFDERFFEVLLSDRNLYRSALFVAPACKILLTAWSKTKKASQFR